MTPVLYYLATPEGDVTAMGDLPRPDYNPLLGPSQHGMPPRRSRSTGATLVAWIALLVASAAVTVLALVAVTAVIHALWWPLLPPMSWTAALALTGVLAAASMAAALLRVLARWSRTGSVD